MLERTNLQVVNETTEPDGRATVFDEADRKGFIKQFGGPDAGSNVVCFRFWQLAHAMGCPFRCTYCFLQTVPYFRFHKRELMGLVYRNSEAMLDEVKEWLKAPPRPLVAAPVMAACAAPVSW